MTMPSYSNSSIFWRLVRNPPISPTHPVSWLSLSSPDVFSGAVPLRSGSSWDSNHPPVVMVGLWFAQAHMNLAMHRISCNRERERGRILEPSCMVEYQSHLVGSMLRHAQAIPNGCISLSLSLEKGKWPFKHWGGISNMIQRGKNGEFTKHNNIAALERTSGVLPFLLAHTLYTWSNPMLLPNGSKPWCAAGFHVPFIHEIGYHGNTMPPYQTLFLEDLRSIESLAHLSL